MASPAFILSLLLVACFSCATYLSGWRQNWEGSRRDASSALAFLLGDSKRMFANHFFVKADVYFHSGYYPTIFDSQKRDEKSHLEETSSHEHDENCNHAEEEASAHEHDEHCDHDEEETQEAKAEDEHNEGGDFLGKPKDIIDRFGRNFYVTSHTHLGQNQERELLPWLKFSATLDPQKIETYTVASYWLRSKLGKAEEAEQFLREGLRNNPWSYEILLELGKIRNENFNDPNGARNLWELALVKWKKQSADGRKPNESSYSQILGNLGALEEQQGNYDVAIRYFELLKKVSPSPEMIEKRIAEMREKKARQ